jgi:LppX_LprAFG lipoprotein
MVEIRQPIGGTMLRRRSLVAIFVVLALGAGACAKSATSTTQNGHLSPFQLVSQAASRTEAEKTARMSMSVSITGGGMTGGSVSMSANGAIDIAKQAAQMTFDMSGIPGAPTSMGFDMVVTGGALYMHLPPSAAAHIPSGKSWLKIDMAALSQQAGTGFGGLSGGSMTAFDPAQTLAYLKGVSKSVTHVGSDTVRGTATERYHVVIDPKKAIDKVSGSVKCGLGAAQKLLGKLTIPADVWIDEQGRLRQMQMRFNMTPPGTTQPVGMTMQMDLFDFGTPVDVTAPPSSQVYDATAGIASHLPSTCAGTQA